MRTKWYHLNYSLTFSLSSTWLPPIMFLGMLISYVIIAESALTLTFLFLLGLAFFFTLISVLITYVIIYTTPTAIGIDDENLIIKRMVGEISIPWESITHFYPLYRWRSRPKWNTSWGISSPHLPKEFKFLYWGSYFADWTRVRGFLQPSVFIPEGKGSQKEAIQAIRAHIEGARKSDPTE